MAMLHCTFLTVVAFALAPHATSEMTHSPVFALLAQLQQQQQARRQSIRGSMLALFQRTEPVSNGQTTEQTFHALDTNADGLLSRDEIGTFAASQGLDAASAQSELSSLDSNGDGALNMLEFVGVLSSVGAAAAQNPADATATAVAFAAVPPQATLPAQAAVQQAAQAPLGLATLASGAGTATRAPVSPAALPTLAENLKSVSMASASTESGSESASARAKQLMASWSKLESDAKQAEAEAAALRAKASEELQQAQELSAIADYAMMRAKQAAAFLPAGEEAAAGGNTTVSM